MGNDCKNISPNLALVGCFVLGLIFFTIGTEINKNIFAVYYGSFTAFYGLHYRRHLVFLFCGVSGRQKEYKNPLPN